MPPIPQAFSRDQILSLIKSFSGQLNIISVPRLFVEITQDANLALMLSQLLYWTDRTVRSDGFVFKSNQDWKSEVGVSRYAITKFNQLPFIETKILRANGSPTTHYRILFEILVDQIMTYLKMEMPISDNPNAEIRQSIVRNQTIQMPISDNPLPEIEQSLTEITTKTTTEITSVKDIAPVGAIIPEKNSKSVRKKSKSKTENETASKQKTEPSQWEMMQAIAKVTGFDLKVTDLAARVGRVAKQLNKAGYTPQDVRSFETYWKENDWRWQKSRALPQPTDIQKMIAASKQEFKPSLTQEERRALALQELEEYRKSLEVQNASMQP